MLRECLSGGKVTFAGEYYQVRSFRLGIELGDRRPKIILGALGEGMLRLAGARPGVAELPAGQPRALVRGARPPRRGRDDLRQHPRRRRRPGSRRTAGPVSGPPARTGSQGGTVYRRDWRRALGPRPGSYSACRRHQPATGGDRIGPNRSADRSDPLPAMASDQGWHGGAVSAVPPGRLWLRERSRAVLVPVVSVPFPVPGRGLACPGTGPGKAMPAVG